MADKMTFDKAFYRLEEINEILQSKRIIDVEKIVEMQSEAKKLFAFCKSILDKTEKDLSESTQ